MYFHRSLQLFLSVYVDDFKMAGKTENIGPMRKKLAEKLDLEPPTPLDGNVYLGCKQNDIKVDAKLLQSKEDMYQTVFQGSSMDATGNLTDIAKPIKPGKPTTLIGTCSERGGGKLHLNV